MKSIFNFKKKKIAFNLMLVYFLLAFINFFAEFFDDKQFLTYTIPLFIPVLILIYWNMTIKPSYLFVISFFSVWFYYLIFQFNDYQNSLPGNLIYLIYVVLILYLIIKNTIFPGILNFLIGALPVAALFGFVFIVLNLKTNENNHLYIVNSLFLVILSGFSLGSYFVKSNRLNLYMSLFTIVFILAQLVLMLKYLDFSENVSNAFSMVFTFFGFYVLTKFFIELEKKKHNYKDPEKLRYY